MHFLISTSWEVGGDLNRDFKKSLLLETLALRNMLTKLKGNDLKITEEKGSFPYKTTATLN